MVTINGYNPPHNQTIDEAVFPQWLSELFCYMGVSSSSFLTHHAASADLPSSYSAGWCNVLLFKLSIYTLASALYYRKCEWLHQATFFWYSVIQSLAWLLWLICIYEAKKPAVRRSTNLAITTWPLSDSLSPYLCTLPDSDA